MSPPTSDNFNKGSAGTQDARRVWWKEASVYQIYPASFCDSNGDGIGDIPGIITKLDYLKHLGVDVLWLCPVYESPQVDMGYDIADYRSIHRPYGTLKDVENLITGLHERGMKLVMDLVVNHTSDQHAWFQESMSSLNSSKRDWYIWKKPLFDAQGNRHPPNNWESIFGGSAWAYDEVTGEYFLHLFCKEQPDLNWENPIVVEEVHDVMRFWLNKGVDGFRMDVINLISKTPGFPDAPTTVPGQEFQPAHHYYANGPRLHEFLRGLRQILDQYDAFAVGEMPWAEDEGDVINSVAADRKELNMIFQFDIVSMDNGPGGKFSPKPWSPRTLKDIVEKWQTCMYENNGWNALFLENHDQSRSVSRFTPHHSLNWKFAAKMLATFIGLQSGTLFVYQGQELGMSNLPREWPIEEYKDVETQNFYELAQERLAGDEVSLELFLDEVRLKARDHARSPVQWNSEQYGGFSTGVPWMRVNEDYVQRNAEQQLADPTSVFSHWRHVLELRRQYREIFIYSGFKMVDREHPAVLCYQRVGRTASATIVANLTEGEQEWSLPQATEDSLKNGTTVLANYGTRKELRGHILLLRPFESFVLLEQGSSYHL
ncbi:glycoside hydrolase family 13 protein [Dactylonectria estremocensis]|uniref:Glycoside hydrolase family 13 protein n=1 Tax=Dactylonectria estremocensis TaxID=1079267 RepID=A0A9P9D5Y2_9HYPO|nr:glycoside hydrolase family 13 protein [Dactylonectria estremocensis]